MDSPRLQVQEMKRFFIEKAEPGAVVTPAPQEEYHMRRVMRIEDGTHVALFDGSGREFEAVVETGQDGTQTVCRVLEEVSRSAELPIAVTVYQALIKGDHFDYAVQKAVEAGAACIVPFTSERCVRRPANQEKLLARTQRIAQEAARQCGRSIVPVIESCVTFSEVCRGAETMPTLVAYEGEDRRSLRDVFEAGCPEQLAIVIGPEGGFTPQEIDEITRCGAQCVTLGPRILRSETAAPYILAQIAYACER